MNTVHTRGFLGAMSRSEVSKIFGPWVLLGLFLSGVGFLSNGKSFSQIPEEGVSEPNQAREREGVTSDQKIRGKVANRLQVGDRIRVKIYPEDEYIKGGEMEVSSEGTITLPLIGKIRIEGMFPSEVEREIVRLLAQDYLVSPVVVIEVAEKVVEKGKRSVAILGQVQKPGTYDFPADQELTLLQLISMAGGFSDVANVKNIKVIRKEKDKTSIIRANAEEIISGKERDIELRPDDIIHVAESFF